VSGVDLRAYRRFKEPKKVRRVIVGINKALLGKTFRKDAAKIFKELSVMGDEQMAHLLKSKGYIMVGNIKLDKEFFWIKEEEKTVHGERFFPHVAEPSFGAERLLYTVLNYAYTRRDGRIVLRIPEELVPIQVAVYPLVTRDGLDAKAREVYEMLKEEGFSVLYDDSAFIGKLYARGDEIGIPIAVTIDYTTLEDNTVTLRNRDTWKQVRVDISILAKTLRSYFTGEKRFIDLGTPFTAS